MAAPSRPLNLSASRKGESKQGDATMNNMYRRPFDLDPALGFESRALVDLLRYWQEKCGARAMPQRADIDPVTTLCGLILVSWC